LAVSLFAQFAIAHETDQYTIPAGREFADLGRYLTKFFYDAIEKGVEKQNKRIREAQHFGGKEAAAAVSADELAFTVNAQFPIALVLIDDLDKLTTGNSIKLEYPGKLVGYKDSRELRKHVDLPLNPFNSWECATFQAYGVLLGTDKIGHFTDMGMHYYRAFRNAKKSGASDEAAIKIMLDEGTRSPVYSERGILGLKTAGAYSNADLVANYMGMCFYRNLTEPVSLKGVTRPPMCVRDGQFWRVADHVRPDSDFFSWFISDHFNEALNPSLYKKEIRSGIRQQIVKHRKDVIARYRDANGNAWSPRRFEQETRALFTYWGFDYGHWGDSELMTITTTCFAKAPDMNDPHARNDDGLTSLHYAAMNGDAAALRRLLDAGGDVNARVQTTVNAPATNGDTPLHLAAKDGQLAAVQLLLERGADPNAINDRGDAPLHMAVEFPAVARLLVERGANIDLADAAGRTPLHWAARDARASAGVQLLLDDGAKPQPVDRDGQTPLHDAARAGHADAIAALIKGGADADATDRFGITPLHLAAAEGGAAASDLLVRAGASVNARDVFGCTPIFVAARNGAMQTVAALLQRNADVLIPDAYGKTASAVAQDRGFAAIARVVAAHADEAQTASQRQLPSRAPTPTFSNGH
jgi:ankyrin repeat protein